MRKIIAALLLLSIFAAKAQEEVIQSVYFDNNKSSVDDVQAKAVIDYIRKTDSTRIESVQIYGYTDDTGKDA